MDMLNVMNEDDLIFGCSLVGVCVRLRLKNEFVIPLDDGQSKSKQPILEI